MWWQYSILFDTTQIKWSYFVCVCVELTAAADLIFKVKNQKNDWFIFFTFTGVLVTMLLLLSFSNSVNTVFHFLIVLGKNCRKTGEVWFSFIFCHRQFITATIKWYLFTAVQFNHRLPVCVCLLWRQSLTLGLCFKISRTRFGFLICGSGSWKAACSAVPFGRPWATVSVRRTEELYSIFLFLSRHFPSCSPFSSLQTVSFQFIIFVFEFYLI